ncbi:MAG TPA: hypothetical protein VGG46_15075 [Terriglobales bacterium]|jgi:hypothetical protein
MAGRLRFKNGVPFAFKLVSVVIVLNFVVEFSLLLSLSKFASKFPIGSATYAILRGKNIYFVHPWLGRYLTTGAWVQFVLLAVLILVLILNRSQIERQ